MGKDIWQLDTGLLYEVTNTFRDFDNRIHQSGEKWFFVELNYLPKSGVYILFVKDEYEIVSGFRLLYNSVHQQEVISNFMNYIKIA